MNRLDALNRLLAPAAGQLAPDFSLPSIQGPTIQLKKYLGRKNVILWFSRGFTCPNCRGFIDHIGSDYQNLVANNIEVIQISPNLHQSAVNFFGNEPPAFPMLCDPDKRLFAAYGIGDQGAFKATRNTVAAFTKAARIGEFGKTVRASAMDVVNRSFIQRLHHHALTALNQAIIAIDTEGKIRHRVEVASLASIPSTPEMIKMLQAPADPSSLH